MQGLEIRQLQHLLKQVSRSFYLTLRVLPVSIRGQIGIAYLLARATDTIADTRLVSVERRRAALYDMRRAISSAAEGRPSPSPDFGDLAAARQAPAGQGSPAEHSLLKSVERVLIVLQGFPAEDRRRIGEVLDIIAGGQDLDLARFSFAQPGEIVALNTDAELDDYTYRVAGCVGEFWTRMCRAHLFPETPLDDASLLHNGVRFGKGLQLVNILRDLPGDLRQGRCYLPRTALLKQGLSPEDLLIPGEMERFRPLCLHFLQQAEDNLAAGWTYTKALPRRQMRVRLACAWPILIGVKTLCRLKTGNVLDDGQRIKISRSEIRRLIFHSVVCYPSDRAWDRVFSRARKL